MEGGNNMDLVAIVWMGLLIAFLVVEAACPIHLVSIWFATGSLAALVVYWLHGPLWLQVLLFFVVSGGLLAALWPFTKKFLNPHLTATNIDSVIGSIGIVTSSIDNIEAHGQVKLNGMEWTARSTTGEPIAAHARVQVDKIEGVKVFVSPVEIPETV